jgi:hypothetical protein
MAKKLKGKAKKEQVREAIRLRGIRQNGHHYKERNRRHRLAPLTGG